MIYKKGSISKWYDNRFSDIKNLTVHVGVLPTGKYPGDKSLMFVEDVAEIMEYGGKETPERSFIRAPLVASRERLKKAANKAAIHNDLSILGEEMVAICKEAILARIDPANAPSTIKRKGSDIPLIDTGLLFESIVYRVVPK